MKDLNTGLSIATTTHIPQPLLKAVLKDNTSGTPLIFFAEVLRKISKNGIRRGTKRRLIVVTPDQLVVYDEDGDPKRRIKIADITAVYFTEEAAWPPQQQHSGDEVSPARRTARFASIGLVVAGTYDMAFDLVSEGTNAARPMDHINHLIRVITVLQRRVSYLRRELVVGIHPPTASELFEGLFNLKKPRGVPAQPVLAPSIDVVSEESEKKKTSDAKIMVDEAIADLLTELDKYRKENWSRKHRQYLALVRDYAGSKDRLESIGIETAERKAALEVVAEIAARRGAEVHADLTSARQRYVGVLEELSQLTQAHNDAVVDIRERGNAATERTARVVNSQTEAHQNFVERMRRLDAIVEDLLGERDDVQRELRLRDGLPTSIDLQVEIDNLRAAAAHVNEATEENISDEAIRDEVASTSRQLQGENSDLEADVLAARTVLREVAEEEKSLQFQRSTLEAKRKRLIAEIQDMEEVALRLERDLQMSVTTREQRENLLELTKLRASTVELETVVTEDLEREAEMHNSIANSTTMVQITELHGAASEETALRARLHELKEKRLRMMAGDAAAANSTGITPRSTVSAYSSPTPGNSTRGGRVNQSYTETPRTAASSIPPYAAPRLGQ